jgi:hypothetical protein
MYFSASSSGGTPAFYIEILKYDGTTFTSIANNSANPEGITNGTATDLYVCAVPVPLTTLLPTDRIALRVYIVNSVIGRTITNHTQNSHLCQIITTFSSGVSSINGLTEQTQYLAVGTAGTDFAINSATDTHTFNLPTASATNRGALSSANWSTFNGKQNQITLTTTGSGAATFIADTLNIPTPSGGTPAGSTGQIQFNNAGSFGADSALFWDNTNKRLGVGATPSTTVRLDVRAQGALSTDIAFRVRNSANTQNLIEILGSGKYRLGDEAGGLSNAFSYVADGRLFMVKSVSNFIELNNSGINRIYNPTGGWEITGNTTLATQAVSGSGGSGAFYYFAGTMQIGALVATGGASNSLWISNGVVPTLTYPDRHWYYSADIVAGNAAPHFRTENGGIIKLYKETTAITASTFVSNTSLIANDTATFDGYTIGQVVKALRNLGILA